MRQTFSGEQLVKFHTRLDKSDSSSELPFFYQRNPVHVVYGGANLFKAETPKKLGKIALNSLEDFAGNFVEFADAFWLNGADSLPNHLEIIEDLEFHLADKPDKVKRENYSAWFAWTVYQKTVEKLKIEPVEDFRIDFEDGYGIRSDSEEDTHCISASDELALAIEQKLLPAFIGFRIKSFSPETRSRAFRTFDIFLTNLLEKTSGKIPEHFVVTLPKVTCKDEVQVLAELISEFEIKHDLPQRSINLEIVVETPQAFINQNGEIALKKFVEAAEGRCTAVHFGAYDYTASFGISGNHQHLQHEACNFARQLMQISLAPLGIRLSDSVTTEMPIPVFRGENLNKSQINENKRVVKKAWRKHFNNVTNSMINGFYQSWDLHPAQLVARYAAIYAFFLESQESQAIRLKGFLEKATKAMVTGNQFDDAASAQGLLNFFIRALNCDALSENEILNETGLSSKELRSASFIKILENRRRSE